MLNKSTYLIYEAENLVEMLMNFQFRNKSKESMYIRGTTN